MKIFLWLLCISACYDTAGQNNYKKREALTISFFLNDFTGAREIKTEGLGHVLSSGSFFRKNNLISGIAFGYINGLNSHVDIVSNIEGSFINYSSLNQLPGKKFLLLESTSGINLKLNTDKHFFTPFLNVAGGISKYKNHYGAFIPAGIGCQVNYLNEAFLILNWQYRIPVSGNSAAHLWYSITMAGNIGKKNKILKNNCKPLPIILSSVPGSHGDGICDKADLFSRIPEVKKYDVPDTDNDGINDEEDKCLTVNGVARYSGCPVPDTDHDEVNDEEDKCPDQPGFELNGGCPAIKKEIMEKVNLAAQNIFFETARADLLSKSFTPLNEIVVLLKASPLYTITVEGHTDITGTNEKNIILSKSRANTVKSYLTAHGIEESRIKVSGYGSGRPVAENITAEGRSKNRRVEIKLEND